MLESFLYLVAAIGYGLYFDLNLLETPLVPGGDCAGAAGASFTVLPFERLWRRCVRIGPAASAGGRGPFFSRPLAVRAAFQPVFPVPHPGHHR